MKVITAPEDVNWWEWMDYPVVFLAGSIEMGKAELWQDKVIAACKEQSVVLLNPRRKDWDESWIQSIDNPQFKEQVNWELNGLLEHATYNFFYFQPGTVSPITLMELGLVMSKFHHKTIVVCPDGYLRKGNVDIVCQRCGIEVLPSLERGIDRLLYFIGKYHEIK